jgi:hypothetical protein
MIAPADRFAQNCAAASLNQMRGLAETAPPSVREHAQTPAVISFGPLPKLPLQDCARTATATLHPVSAGAAAVALPKLEFPFSVSVLLRFSSLGGETTPYGGGGERRTRVLPRPPPGGFARVVCPRPNHLIRRRRPRTAKHQTAVVFHPSSQPEEETTHG